MPNTTLPTSGINDGDNNHIPHHEIVHAEINRMSRDTGLIDVTSNLVNGWTANYVGIRRVDDTVTLYVDGLDGTSATSTIFLNVGSGGSSVLSSGFMPDTVPSRSPLYLQDDGELMTLYVQGGAPGAFRAMKADSSRAGAMSTGAQQWVYKTDRFFPSA